MEEIELKDIADELIIIPKATLDKLFSLDNGIDCVGLYMFYYKTAKWQKTNQIKATDNFVKKGTGLGTIRLANAKKALKENGLIEIIQRRSNDKVEGWYVKVNYIISENKTPKTLIQGMLSKNSVFKNLENQQLRNQKQMLKEDNIKCLKNNNNKMLYKDFVSMTENEYNTLVEKYGIDFVQRCIEVLDNYKGANGKKYKSDYRAILSWVVDRVIRDGMKPRPTPKKEDDIEKYESAQQKYSDKILLEQEKPKTLTEEQARAIGKFINN